MSNEEDTVSHSSPSEEVRDTDSPLLRSNENRSAILEVRPQALPPSKRSSPSPAAASIQETEEDDNSMDYDDGVEDLEDVKNVTTHVDDHDNPPPVSSPVLSSSSLSSSVPIDPSLDPTVDEFNDIVPAFPKFYSSIPPNEILELMMLYNDMMNALLSDKSSRLMQVQLDLMNEAMTHVIQYYEAELITDDAFSIISPCMRKVRQIVLLPHFKARRDTTKPTPTVASPVLPTFDSNSVNASPSPIVPPPANINQVVFGWDGTKTVHRDANTRIYNFKYAPPPLTGADSSAFTSLQKLGTESVKTPEVTAFVAFLKACYEDSEKAATRRWWDYTETIIGIARTYLSSIASRGVGDLTTTLFELPNQSGSSSSSSSSSLSSSSSSWAAQELAASGASSGTRSSSDTFPTPLPRDSDAIVIQQMEAAREQCAQEFPTGLTDVYCLSVSGDSAQFTMTPYRHLQLFARQTFGLRVSKTLHHVLLHAHETDASGAPLLPPLIQLLLAEHINACKANPNPDAFPKYHDTFDKYNAILYLVKIAFPKIQIGMDRIHRIRYALHDSSGYYFASVLKEYFKAIQFNHKITYADNWAQLQQACHAISGARTLMSLPDTSYGVNLTTLSNIDCAALWFLGQAAATYMGRSSNDSAKAWFTANPKWWDQCNADPSLAPSKVNSFITSLPAGTKPPAPLKPNPVKRSILPAFKSQPEPVAHANAAAVKEPVVKKLKTASLDPSYAIGVATRKVTPKTFYHGFNYGAATVASVRNKAAWPLVACTIKATEWINKLFKKDTQGNFKVTNGIFEFNDERINWVNCTSKECSLADGQKGYLSFFRLLFGYNPAHQPSAQSMKTLPTWMSQITTKCKKQGIDFSSLPASY